VNSGSRLSVSDSAPLHKERQNYGDNWEGAHVGTSCFNRHDVVDMKGRFLAFLRKTAILASVAGALNNEPSEPG